MEILIDSNNITNIIMKDKDILNISTSKLGNTNQVKCKYGVLHFDNISSDEIIDLKNEKQAIKSMKQFLENQKCKNR